MHIPKILQSEKLAFQLPFREHREHHRGTARNGHSEAEGRGICFFFSLALLLACLAAPVTAAAEELGRLFLTPQQRQDLERMRATKRTEVAKPQIKEGPLTLEGQVQRSDGKTVTWINGVPQYDSRASRDPSRVTLAPNAGGPGVSIKIGQTYERASGTVRDPLNDGAITVGTPSSKNELAAQRGAAAKSPAPTR